MEGLNWSETDWQEFDLKVGESQILMADKMLNELTAFLRENNHPIAKQVFAQVQRLKIELNS